VEDLQNRFVPRGYFGLGMESLDHEDDFESKRESGRQKDDSGACSKDCVGRGDLKEGLDMGACKTPSSIEQLTKYPSSVQTINGRRKGDEFRETSDTYSCKMLKCSRTLLKLFDLASESYNEVFLKESETPVATLRLLHYPGIPDSDHHTGKSSLACGAHSDYGLFTILFDGGVPGLQVLPPETSTAWINVKPIPGTFVVNTGAMMHRWTAGAFQNTIHRVWHVPGVRDRISIPFFFNPSPSAIISPMPCAGSQTPSAFAQAPRSHMQ